MRELKPKINTKLGGIIDKTSYLNLFYLLISIILIFSTLFYFLNSSGNGTNKPNLKFYDALYFSVATISTLGYGDISPVGFSKFLVMIEVLFGLSLTAVLIGKISSERQSTKLTLIYSSINHQRILEFIEKVDNQDYSINFNYKVHDNHTLNQDVVAIYDMICVIRKYLIMQSLEGDLAKFGNSSTLRRLYVSISKAQKTLNLVKNTYGIDKRIIKTCNWTNDVIGDIGTKMKQFHNEEFKILGILNELELECNRFRNNSNIVKYRTYIDKELLNRIIIIISNYKNPTQEYREIAQSIGMTNKLMKKCLEKINIA